MSSDSSEIFLELQIDPRWMELPVHGSGEAGQWACEATDEALALRGVIESAPVRQLYTQTYAAIVERLRERADGDGSRLAAAFALIGDADLLPVTIAELAVHRLESGQGVHEFIEEIVVAPHLRFAAPDVTELATGLGTSLRVQQLRIVDEGEGEEPSVQTSVVHVWPGPSDGLVTTLSAWFGAPVDAETSRSVLQGLAASLRRRPG